MKDLYTYKAVVNRVVDGDTCDLSIDLGFTVSWKSTCRFYGINTPELRSKVSDEKALAYAARDRVLTLLPPGSTILIKSRELDKYGRPLVDVYTGENFSIHVNQLLVQEGLAKTYLP
jgi:micrococcal nuclease